MSADIRHDLQRLQAARKYPTDRAHERTQLVQAGHRIGTAFPQGSHQQVPHRVPAEFTIPGEAVLQDIGPRPRGRILRAQRGHRHPKVTGWQYSEIPSKASARTTVIRHTHNGSDAVGDFAQTLQGHR